MSTPPTVTIGRLALHPGALTPAQAQRLAELVGLALGRIPFRSAERVSVSVPTQSAQTLEQIADTVVRAIEDALRMDGAQ